MDFKSIQSLDQTYVAHTYGRFPLALAQGKDAVCTDVDGKSYIDFTAGIGVNSLGFCNDQWVNAVCKQAATLNHTSNLYYTDARFRACGKALQKSQYAARVFCQFRRRGQ